MVPFKKPEDIFEFSDYGYSNVHGILTQIRVIPNS